MSSKPYVLAGCDPCSGGVAPTETLLYALSTTTTPVAAGTDTAVLFSVAPISNNITCVPPTTNITIVENGAYLLHASFQLEHTAVGAHDIVAWVNVNGTPVANSASTQSLRNNELNVLSVPLILSLVAGDVVTIHVWSSDVFSVTTSPPDLLVPYPQGPAVILSMFKLK